MSFLEQIEDQYIRFDQIRDEIHHELIEAGIDEVIEATGIHLDTQPYEPHIPRAWKEAMERESPPQNLQYLIDKAWRPYKGKTKIARYVVSRSRTYTTELADMDIDLDPTAEVLATQFEVGVAETIYKEGSGVHEGTSLHVVNISEALNGETQEPISAGLQLNFSQIAVIEGAIKKLYKAKTEGNPKLTYLTKSLTKINSAGD